MEKRNATVAVQSGAGDYIGGEIAKKFARLKGFTVFAGRRDDASWRPLGQGDRGIGRIRFRGCAR